MEYVLYHHGIIGQKWGKRNGPPYPLDAGSYSAAEKRAGKLDEKIEKNKVRASRAESKRAKAAAKANRDFQRKKIYKKSAAKQEKFYKKWTEDQEKYTNQRNKYIENVHKYRSEVERIVDGLNRRGYSITSDELRSRGRTGRIATQRVLKTMAAVELVLGVAGYTVALSPYIQAYAHIRKNAKRVAAGIGSVRV